MRPFAHDLVILLALVALSGCSISYSGEKSSDSISESLDSISASFDSFSNSSGSGKDEVAALIDRFYNDVSGLTRVWISEEREPNDFENRLRGLAFQHGVIDWESDPEAFYAIGNGLRQAGINSMTISHQPIMQSSLMKKNEAFIVAGYQSS